MSGHSEVEGKPHYDHANGHGLSRQVTLQLSADQYERLFFQPTASKGDLAKRLGNPTLLGLLGFLVPFSCIIFSTLTFQGSSPLSIVGISGTFYFFGGLSMTISGIMEFILGNTFPMVVFIIYGSHFVYLGYVNDPSHGIVNSYTAGGVPGALSQTFNASQGNYTAVMAIVTFCFLCASLRTNVPFVIVFFCLMFLFSFFSAAYYQLGHNPTVEGLDHAFYYFKIAGGFGFVSMIMGWYLAVITACASTGVPCPLPVFDLSTKFGAGNENAAKAEHAGSVTNPEAIRN